MNQLHQSLINLLSDTLNVIPLQGQHSAIAIHELRKLTKYMRALLQLNPATHREVSKNLKSISAVLAPYRDAQVNMDIYTLLTDNSPHLHEAELERSLRGNPFYLDAKPISALAENIEQLLSDLDRNLQQLAPEPDPELIFELIHEGYASGYQAMDQVKLDPNMEDLHSWRKKTKRLWYQLRFLFGDTVEALNHPLNLSDQLGQLLGEIHDSDVFDLLLTSPSYSKLHEFINNRRSLLLQEAFDSGERLYHVGNSEFDQLLRSA